MPKKQSSGLPTSYEQQQQIRQQRQRMMTEKGHEQMEYVQGSGSSAAGSVKKQSESVDYSKARSGGYSGPSLSVLDEMLERAKASGNASRIKSIQDQIRIAKKQGAK